MSIADILHQKINQLSEVQQQELLSIANQLLNSNNSGMDAQPPVSETEEELNQELLHRYTHLRANPEQVVSARGSNQQLRGKYSW